MISIHAPARGATPDQRRGRDHHEDFNPRPREGGDTKTGSCARNPADFNPRPREGGERRRVRIPQALCDISIHAPREGGDGPERRRHGTRPKFQSTPPARGATDDLDDSPSGACISIHAPREGGDQKGALSCAVAIYFNPRPPRGGRPRQKKSTVPYPLFQSTPPARGATFAGVGVPEVFDISIHAPREGGDGYESGPQGLYHNFNPRPREGGDRSTDGR